MMDSPFCYHPQEKEGVCKYCDPVSLTFLAEEAGAISLDETLRICCVAICHPKPFVREGALYGMANHTDDPDIRAMVTYVSEHDDSPTIRRIAKEVLDDF